MKISLEKDVIDTLSLKGIIAYVAVMLAEGTTASTAALAGLVKCRTEIMKEGLEELINCYGPTFLQKHASKWICGDRPQPLGETVQILDSSRYREFLDDLKIYHDKLNPNGPSFAMGARDGQVIQRFLKDHPNWSQEDWRRALHNRAIAVLKFAAASRTEPFYAWIGNLGSYGAGPLDRFGKPVEGGNGRHEKAIGVQNANRDAGEKFITNLRTRRGS
jgi:hypothetical protein